MATQTGIHFYLYVFPIELFVVHTHTPLLLLPSSVLLGLSTERSFAAAPRISFTVGTSGKLISLTASSDVFKSSCLLIRARCLSEAGEINFFLEKRDFNFHLFN